jgi:hypothetical protein
MRSPGPASSHHNGPGFLETLSASGTKRQQFGSVLPQPLALVAPTWTPPLDKRPEALRVVRDAEVTKLMHNDVIEHLERR